MSKSNSTLRNYSFNMVGSIWEAFTDVACMAIIARYLDLSLFGDYAFVMAFVAIFRVVCGASLPVIITREIAVNKENGPIMSLITLSLIVLIINLIHQGNQVIHATYLATLGVIFDFLGIFFISVVRGYERMEYAAYRLIIRQTLYLLLLLWLVQIKKEGFLYIFVFFMVTHFIGLIYSIYITLRRFLRPVASLDIRLCKYLFMEAYPIAIRRFVRKLGFRIDTILLNFLKGSVEVGLFHGAYRVLQGFMFVGESLIVSVFPVLSQHYAADRKSLDEVYEGSFRFLAVTGYLFGIMLFTYSTELVTVILGQKYLAAANVLKVFSPLIVFMFLTKLAERMLIVASRQSYATIIAVVALVLNVIFDLVLIPFMGIIGASIATLLAETVLFILGFYFTYRFVSQVSIHICLFKVLFVYSLTCILITLSNVYIGRLPGFFFGPLFYVLGVLLLGVVSISEVEKMRDTLFDAFKRKARPESF